VIAFVLALSIFVPGMFTEAEVCPVDAPIEYSDSYMIWAKNRRHKGIDAYAAMGAHVVAPELGMLSYGEGGKGGLTAKLYTPDGDLYYFAHLAFQRLTGHLNWDADGFLAVRAGTIIGGVGDTGNARGTEPHLHLEKREDGQRVNPHDLLEAACR
jgi:murein DD-endopeptidase MepM/ murein hydrolase activator NlpD